MKYTLLGLFFYPFIFSCVEKSEQNSSIDREENKVIDNEQDSIVNQIVLDENTIPFDRLINDLPEKTVPTIDTTNFDNFIYTTYYNNIEMELLQLDIVQEDIGYTENLGPLYKLNLSDLFQTIVITLRGESEMYTVLINYDLQGVLVDHLVISYDEIAEGWSRKTAEISKNNILVHDILWIEEKQELIKEYRISEEGNIDIDLNKFRSLIRPNEILIVGEKYTDTIVFISYNDDYDYRYLNAKKKDKDVYFVYNWEHDKIENNFNEGDLIELVWGIDTVWIAGDDERLHYEDWAIKARKIE